jgi:hypothetical protein
MIEDKIKRHLESITDEDKAKLGNSEEVKRFVNLLYDEPRGWKIIEGWRDDVPLFQIENSYELERLKDRVRSILRSNSYINQFASDFLHLYGGFDQKEAEQVNQFLDNLEENSILEKAGDVVNLCPYCGKVEYQQGQEDCTKCDHDNVSMVSIFKCHLTGRLRSAIQKGILLELYVAKSFREHNIGVVCEKLGEKNNVCTSLEFDVGQGTPRDIDVLGYKEASSKDGEFTDLHIIMAECKMGKLSDGKISDKNNDFTNFFEKLRNEFEDEGYRNIIPHKLFVGYNIDKEIEDAPYSRSTLIDIDDLGRLGERVEKKIKRDSFKRSLKEFQTTN